MNERFNEKSQDKKGHKATYTCPWNIIIIIHCVQKNSTDVAYYKFNAHQPILVIFDRNAADSILPNDDLIPRLS